jgi:hypothetical protein
MGAEFAPNLTPDDSANDPPDAISFSFIGDPTPCTDAPPRPLFPMTGGQVTVR